MLKSFSWFLLIVGICVAMSSGALAGEKSTEESTWGLGEVVITATKTPHPLKDVPVETVVITKEEIERSSAQTVSDLLRYVPGIFVRDEDAPGISSWRATIRGLSFNNGYGLILIDGERVRGEGMGDSGIGLNQIPPQMIEKIEVVKGPSSVLYGSDALAGVVNIITKPTPDRTIYGFEGGYGSYWTNMEYLYWGTKAAPWGVLFQASREESEMGQYGVKTNRDETYKRESFLSNFSYEVNPNLVLGLKFTAQEEERKIEYLTQDTVVNRKGYKYRIAPHLKMIFDDDSELIVKGYYYDWKFDADSYGTDPYPYALYKGDMYYRDLEVRYTKPVKTSHLVTLGAEYRQEELDYTFSQRKLDITSAYFQDEIEFHMGFPMEVVAGARLDHHSRYGTEFCPKVSLLVKLDEATRVRASVGRGFKSPTIRQAFYTEPYLHRDYFIVSNPDLKAETSWGYSVGIERSIGDIFWGNITFFRNDIKDMIIRYYDYKDINNDGVVEKIRTFRNAKEAYTQGIEVALKLALIKDVLWFNVAYTYLDTEDEDTGKELTFIPNHNLAGHIVFNHKPLGISFDIGIQYVSEMYTNPTNTEKTSSYSVVDVKLVKTIGKHASFSVEGNNIFDSDYGEPDREWWGATWLARFKMDF